MLDIELKLLNNCEKRIYTHVWTPLRAVIVLGNSDKQAESCYQGKCEELGVRIARRKGGGSAVLLHEDCIIVSLGMWVEQYFQNKKYFDLINTAVIKVLAKQHKDFAKLALQGISDIAYDDRKVAGTTIFRSRNYLIYQASLLYHARIDQISALLKQPLRMPDYRADRKHADFLLGLADIAPTVKMQTLQTKLTNDLTQVLAQELDKELIDPPAQQVATLRARARQERLSCSVMG